MDNWKWKYYSTTQGSWHSTFTAFYKVKLDKVTGKEIGEPVSISYEEYLAK